jgi:hypothetical protein
MSVKHREDLGPCLVAAHRGGILRAEPSGEKAETQATDHRNDVRLLDDQPPDHLREF